MLFERQVWILTDKERRDRLINRASRARSAIYSYFADGELSRTSLGSFAYPTLWSYFTKGSKRQSIAVTDFRLTNAASLDARPGGSAFDDRARLDARSCPGPYRHIPQGDCRDFEATRKVGQTLKKKMDDLVSDLGDHYYWGDKLCAAMFVAILTFDSGHARACCSGGSIRSKVT